MKEVSHLVEAAQAGDSEAYAALVQRFQGVAYATAYRRVGDHHLAQDIVQDAIIEAFLHLPQLKEPSAFPGWFRQIVLRQCTRVLRQASIQCTSLEAVSEGGSRTGLVMWMAHERRPLALASSSQEFVVTLVIGTSSQADPVYFLITKPVQEPISFRFFHGGRG